MAISCCRYCVAPKRHPGCHDHCEAHLEEKAKRAEIKEKCDKKRAIDNGIYYQRGIHVYKAMKNRYGKG
jgi:hypothetical protein